MWHHRERNPKNLLTNERAGLQKTYTVACTDSEILQATVDAAALSIGVVGRTDEFNRCICETTAWASLLCSTTEHTPADFLWGHWQPWPHSIKSRLPASAAIIPVAQPNNDVALFHHRLLSSFQSSLSEITMIALPEGGGGGGSGGAPARDVKIRSYMDPAKGMQLLLVLFFKTGVDVMSRPLWPDSAVVKPARTWTWYTHQAACSDRQQIYKGSQTRHQGFCAKYLRDIPTHCAGHSDKALYTNLDIDAQMLFSHYENRVRMRSGSNACTLRSKPR